MRKRRRGFPSETKVKRGVRVVHGDKLLEEKLGPALAQIGKQGLSRPTFVADLMTHLFPGIRTKA